MSCGRFGRIAHYRVRMPERDANDEVDAEPPSSQSLPPSPAPSMTGQARALTRPRALKRRLPDTGRRHHLGATPARMPVFGPDGPAQPTRTSAVQLAAATLTELERLHEVIVAEMTEASVALEFEEAARLRDEAAAAHAELSRRTAAARRH